MSNFIVYTCLFGDYEPLRNPFRPEFRGFRKICFTDNPDLRSEGWEIRYCPKSSLDAARESRRYKLMPQCFLPECTWSLYVDNSISFLKSPMHLFEYAVSNGKDMYCFAHELRDCIYDEAETIIIEDIDDERRVRAQMDRYRALGYPEHAGLPAGTVLLRKHGVPSLARMGEIWFEQVLHFSKRDQLSFPFAAQETGVDLGFLPGGLSENEYVQWIPGGYLRTPRGFDADLYSWLHDDVQHSSLSPALHYLLEGEGRPHKRCTSQLNKLANKYRSDKGDIYYGAHAYARIYEQYLAEWRERPIRLLEIGLLRHDLQRRLSPPFADTPSLSMWKEYFPQAEIYGFDIADFSATPATPGVHVIQGDMGRVEDLERLLETSGGAFDVIIDDASHASHHQQRALACLFPHLNPGGFYIIEDLCFQPPDLERDGIPKTATILRDLRNRVLIPTAFISAEALHLIHRQSAEIVFYDSQSDLYPVVLRDSLAIIRKK